MSSSTPWPDDGDAEFLRELMKPTPAPPPVTGVLKAVLDALRFHNENYYGPNPVEVRMNLDTGMLLALEAGLDKPTRNDLEGGTVLGLVISLDEGLANGEVIIWPTPDEWAATQFVANPKWSSSDPMKEEK